MVEHALIVRHPTGPQILVDARAAPLRLPRVRAADRHTAEVDYLNAAVQAELGLRTTVLRSLRHDVDARTGAMTRLHELEVHGGAPAAGFEWIDGRRWRALPPDDAAAVEQWRTDGDGPPPDGRAWTRPGWFGEIRAWIESRLRVTGIEGPVEVEQLRAWPSSCVLRVRAGGTELYCKAVAESGRRECGVTAHLGRYFPDAVPAVLAEDEARRWLLLRGCPGVKLEDIADVAAWERAAAMYARMQVGCIAQAGALRALGCPERRPEALAAGLDELAADADALRGGAEGLSTAEVERVRALVPEVARRAAVLRSGAVPPTLEHGDLWPGNFLIDARSCVLIDWEDVAVGHPFFSLAPLLVGLASYQPALDGEAVRRRLCDAYLAPFAALAAPDALREALRLAAPLSFVDMALRYRSQRPSVVLLHPWMADLVPQTLRMALAELE